MLNKIFVAFSLAQSETRVSTSILVGCAPQFFKQKLVLSEVISAAREGINSPYSLNISHT